MSDAARQMTGNALAPLDALRNRIRVASWYAAVGEELTSGERWDARAYLAGLGFA